MASHKFIHVPTLFALLLLLITSCTTISTPEPTSKPSHTEPPSQPPTTVSAQLNLVTEPLPENRLNVPSVYSGNQLCYLGSYAMLAKFKDNDIEFRDVVANSGIGGSAAYIPEKSIIYDGYWYGCIGLAAKNQGYDYYIAALKGTQAIDNPLAQDFIGNAKDVIALENEDEALKLLKRLISSGIPVSVRLDTFFMKEPLISYTSRWEGIFDYMGSIHVPHNMTVTGYDENYVYLHDPIEKVEDKGKDIPVNTDSFLQAWASGNGPDWNKVFAQFVTKESLELVQIPAWNSGPYWMLFLGKRGTAKDIDELLSWNREIVANAAQEIRKATDTPAMYYAPDCEQMYQARKEFGFFLRENGYADAGNILVETSRLFRGLCWSIYQYDDLVTIADLQEQAAAKMQGESSALPNKEQDGKLSFEATKYINKKYNVSVSYPKHWLDDPTKTQFDLFKVHARPGLPVLSLASWDIWGNPSLEESVMGHVNWFKDNDHTNVDVISQLETTLADGTTPAYEIIIDFTNQDGWHGRNLYLQYYMDYKCFAAIATDGQDWYADYEPILREIVYSLQFE